VSWKNDILASTAEIHSDGIVQGHIFYDEGKLFHESKSKGANLRELSKSKTHQANWEKPSYEKIFTAYLSDLPKDLVVADLGCDDGRFVAYLLDQGFNKIVALDSHKMALFSLQNYLREINQLEKVLLIHSSVNELPIKDNSLDMALIINVLYYLGAKEEDALKKIVSKIKPDGEAIITDHNYEALLLRALIFNGFDDFIKTAKTGQFKETDKVTQHYFPSRKVKDFEDYYNRNGLEIIDTKGISLFHQFLNISRAKGHISDKLIVNQLETILKLFNDLQENGTLVKTFVHHLKKLNK